MVTYKKAVFFDRDGVINKEVGVINKLNQFKILKNSIKAIKLLNSNNIPCFLKNFLFYFYLFLIKLD